MVNGQKTNGLVLDTGWKIESRRPGMLFLLFFVCYSSNHHGAMASNDEFRLYTDLLTNYNPLERPVVNSSEKLIVKIWYDYKLVWTPSEYGGIRDVRFPGSADQIWKPDVLLYNSADENFDSTYKSNLLVYSTGEVNWIPPGILKFSCKIDITWFPFDDQICGLKFGSWTFHGFAMDLRIDSDDENSTHQMDLSDYVVNGEWLLMATPAKRVELFYKCCPEPYPTITFSMHIRRRTLYYGFNLIIPSLLISLMTILGFTLPPDAGEKITLEITILLSVCFFLSMVAEMTPPTSEAVPLIGVFFSCCMLVVSASVVFTVLVLNLHFRTPDTHMKKILLVWLPWFMMMSRPGHTFSCMECKVDDEPRRSTDEPDPFQEGGGGGGSTTNVGSTSSSASDVQILLLHRVYLELREITARLEKEEDDERVQNDWKFAAMVVDRMCLYAFSIFITVCTCSIMFSAPHLNA